MSMMNVLCTRNGKRGKAEKLADGKYTIIFESGEQKEVTATTFERWYQDLDASEIPDAKDDGGNEEDIVNDEADASSNTSDKDAEKAKADADAEAEKAAKQAEKEAAKAAKQAEADVKKAAKQKEKEEREAKRAELLAKKKAEREAKEAAKAAKDAEKANNPSANDGLAKQRHKEFFTKFLSALNVVDSSVTKANARERNYMSFPAGAKGFKFKFVKTGDVLDCSLYIFGPQVVTSALFKELEKYQEEINASLAHRLNLDNEALIDWSAPEDMKVRRVRIKLTGENDAELIKEGVDTLLAFNQIFVPYIDKITA